MCDSVLSDVLEGKICVNALLEWLSNKSCKSELIASRCTQGDFISFFLNYIHEIQVCVDKSGDTPQKVAVTPKRIERTINHNNDNVNAGGSNKAVAKRRPALFPDTTEPVPLLSTPKTANRHGNLDESYISPISPLYNVQNCSTPKYVSPRLTLADFIVPSRGSSKKKVQRNLNENVFAEEGSGRIRRINPTNVTQRKSGSASFQRLDNSFNFNDSQEFASDNPEGQRSFLIEERLKVISKKNFSDVVPKPFVVTRKIETVPKLESVSFKQELDMIVSLYNFLLENSFVLNITSELYFLVSVLLCKEYENVEVSPDISLCLGVSPLNSTSKSLFKTIHNRVYFASMVLQHQPNTLQFFDKPTLKLLSENKRLKRFTSVAFFVGLTLIYEEKSDRTSDVTEQSSYGNVCFMSDTDNRDNFPTDVSFHAFRKQRDLFYDILRIWENNRLHDEWNFTVALGGKIKALLNMHSEPTNLVHLARLFKAQLLMNASEMSPGASSQGMDGSNGNLSIFSTIPNVNAEKLSRLKSRIVSKQISCGLNSVPTFTGYQEFYRDFILVAVGHVFNRHLIDALISEIVELNETKLYCTEPDDVDYGSIRKSHLMCMRSLRILAKFLGFLETLPYKSERLQLPQKVVSTHILVRNRIQPNFHLKVILERSIENRTLILTVPWVTEYIAMFDYVSLRVPYYEDVSRVLFKIYRADFDRQPIQNNFLIKLCLGWLFELPHFPESLYYTWLSQDVNGTTTEAADNPDNHRDTTPSYKNIYLDDLDIVDQNILYVCCPYLEEIKKLLSSDISHSSNGHITVKHITPLTAVQSSTDLSNKRLQLQLEENFFNGQPVSVRKTVEFVSERVASACVKQICNEMVPAYKKMAVTDLREVLEKLDLEPLLVEDSLKLLNAKASDFATKFLRTLRARIDEQLGPMISERITPAMESLLAADVLEQTKEVCVTITTRSCTERVMQWVNSHVNLGVFTKDFDNEIKRITVNSSGRQSRTKPVFLLPMYGKNVEHNSKALSGVKVVEKIRSLSWELLESPEWATNKIVGDLLDSVGQSIEERCDLNEYIHLLINKMLVDLILLLIAHRSDLLDAELVSKCVRIWKGCPCNRDELFENIVCPKNVALLGQSSEMEKSWRQFKQFVAILMKEGLLTSTNLDAQVEVLKVQNWSEETLFHLSNCIKQMTGDCCNDKTVPLTFPKVENCTVDEHS